MKRSSKVFTFLFCAFAVFFVGISTASADRIYSLEDPRVSWDSSSSHCSVNGQAGTKVSNSATQGLPGGYGCQVPSPVVVVIDPADQAATDYYSLDGGYSCYEAEGSDLMCEAQDDEETTAADPEPNTYGY